MRTRKEIEKEIIVRIFQTANILQTFLDNDLASKNISITNKLFISEACHVILPTHVALDIAHEKSLGKSSIGTTGRGIGTFDADQATDGTGFRRFKYSTDTTINPTTYDDTNDVTVRVN